MIYKNTYKYSEEAKHMLLAKLPLKFHFQFKTILYSLSKTHEGLRTFWYLWHCLAVSVNCFALFLFFSFLVSCRSTKKQSLKKFIVCLCLWNYLAPQFSFRERTIYLSLNKMAPCKCKAGSKTTKNHFYFSNFLQLMENFILLVPPKLQNNRCFSDYLFLYK